MILVMNQKEKYIQTYAGIKIELYIFVLYTVTAIIYGYFNISIIGDEFIIHMLRAFTIFADLGIFLAIGYLIDFKRGIVIGYIYKVLVFLSLEQQHKMGQLDFLKNIVGIPFCLILYYKITLFLIIFVASYITQVDYEQALIQKMQQQQQKKFFNEQQTQKKQDKQTQKTIQRIKKSLRYHKQDQFYKKLQIFYFVMYHSTCILILFPIQQYVIDFSKSLQLSQSIQFLKHIHNLKLINNQLIWYINLHTVINVISYCSIILIGQFKIKSKYPELIKQYILQTPYKFLLIQLLSLIVVVTMLCLMSLSNQVEELRNIALIKIINIEIFAAAYLIHTLLPLFVVFILLRLHLGQIYYLNKLVSLKYNFCKPSLQDQYDNLDYLLYQLSIQNDINKVRHFIIDKKELIPRHKLKRYTEEEKLKHYVNQPIIFQITSLFSDFMILDLWNKLSRVIALVIFYVTLIVFLISMNINDTYVANQDKFFNHVPAILLLFGLGIMFKYESNPNIFYNDIALAIYAKIKNFLINRKAYNFVRLIHFYAIIFSIWIYRIYSQIFLPQHQKSILKIKQKIYFFYSSPSLFRNDLMTSLLSGWKQYFSTNSQSCDYSLLPLLIDSVMLMIVILQILTLKYFYQKNNGKWDTVLVILKLIIPIYAFFVFVINMQCLQWARCFFCIFLCLGITFMSNNQTELERGTKRDEEGNYQS